VSDVRYPNLANRTLPNPAPLIDPCVARIQRRVEVVVGEARWRQAFAPAGNDGAAWISDSHFAITYREALAAPLAPINSDGYRQCK
jgi:hypothetical protein